MSLTAQEKEKLQTHGGDLSVKSPIDEEDEKFIIECCLRRAEKISSLIFNDLPSTKLIDTLCPAISIRIYSTNENTVLNKIAELENNIKDDNQKRLLAKYYFTFAESYCGGDQNQAQYYLKAYTILQTINSVADHDLRNQAVYIARAGFPNNFSKDASDASNNPQTIQYLLEACKNIDQIKEPNPEDFKLQLKCYHAAAKKFRRIEKWEQAFECNQKGLEISQKTGIHTYPNPLKGIVKYYEKFQQWEKAEISQYLVYQGHRDDIKTFQNYEEEAPIPEYVWKLIFKLIKYLSYQFKYNRILETFTDFFNLDPRVTSEIRQYQEFDSVYKCLVGDSIIHPNILSKYFDFRVTHQPQYPGVDINMLIALRLTRWFHHIETLLSNKHSFDEGQLLLDQMKVDIANYIQAPSQNEGWPLLNELNNIPFLKDWLKEKINLQAVENKIIELEKLAKSQTSLQALTAEHPNTAIALLKKQEALESELSGVKQQNIDLKKRIEILEGAKLNLDKSQPLITKFFKEKRGIKRKAETSTQDVSTNKEQKLQ